jgi:site-specific DNA recombinase
MKIIAYIRTSNPLRTQGGVGHEAQEFACREWAEKQNPSEFLVFKDLSVSGTIPYHKRKGMVSALSHLGPGDILVCYKRDRLGRDVIDLAMLHREVAKKKASIFSLSGEGNGDTYEDEFMRTVIDSAATYELNMVRKRTQAAMRLKAQRNEIVSRTPFGCKEDPTGFRLMPHEREFPILMELYKLIDQGYKPCRASTILFRRGLYSRRNGPFTYDSVIQIEKIRLHNLERFRSESFSKYLKDMNIDFPYEKVDHIYPEDTYEDTTLHTIPRTPSP